MSAKNLQLAQSVDKELSKLPKHIQLKIISSFNKIIQNPVSGIKLHGDLKNYYKFRVGDYRIIYSFNTKKSLIQVVKIEHRQGVYK
jgi:mRNA interferase RelE/StbE